MAPKRPIDPSSTSEPPTKKRAGFRVGPANLPDGSWKRKLDRKKADLIHTAKVKKAFAKVKKQHEASGAKPMTFEEEDDETGEKTAGADEDGKTEPADMEIHPSRQAMLDAAPQESEQTRRRREQAAKQRDKAFSERQMPLGQRGSGQNPAGDATQDEVDASQGDESQDQDPVEDNTEPRRRDRRPKKKDISYTSALARAEAAKEAAAAREAEYAKRAAEREGKMKERRKAKKAMARARGIEPRGKRAGKGAGFKGSGTGGTWGRGNDTGRDRLLGREGKILLEKVKKMMGK